MIYLLTITTVTVIAVEMAAHAHPCFICRFLDSLRNSSVLASMVLYSPNCLKRELELVVTEPSLDIVIVDVSHHWTNKWNSKKNASNFFNSKFEFDNKLFLNSASTDTRSDCVCAGKCGGFFAGGGGLCFPLRCAICV